jgi:hypothetical protein
MSPVTLILVIVLLLVVFGGAGGRWGPSWFGPGTTPSQPGWSPVYGGGGIGLVLLILLVLYLLGVFRF